MRDLEEEGGAQASPQQRSLISYLTGRLTLQAKLARLLILAQDTVDLVLLTSVAERIGLLMTDCQATAVGMTRSISDKVRLKAEALRLRVRKFTTRIKTIIVVLNGNRRSLTQENRERIVSALKSIKHSTTFLWPNAFVNNHSTPTAAIRAATLRRVNDDLDTLVGLGLITTSISATHLVDHEKTVYDVRVAIHSEELRFLIAEISNS